MPRLPAIDPATATGPAKPLLDAVQQALGLTPNMFRTFAHSPAVLEGFLSLNSALGKGVLSTQVREQIALTVAESNGCDYCLAAHTALGTMAGLSQEQIKWSRRGEAEEPATRAALALARAIVIRRGNVREADVTEARGAGLDNAAIAEVVANVALNIFTNYFNLVAVTEVDFPRVSPAQAPAAA